MCVCGCGWVGGWVCRGFDLSVGRSQTQVRLLALPDIRKMWPFSYLVPKAAPIPLNPVCCSAQHSHCSSFSPKTLRVVGLHFDPRYFRVHPLNGPRHCTAKCSMSMCTCLMDWLPEPIERDGARG